MSDANDIFRIFSIVLVLAALSNAVLAGVYWRRSLLKHNGWKNTEGEIIEVNEDLRDGNICRFPIVAFQDENGDRHIFKSDFTRTNWDIVAGDLMPVIYDTVNPDKAEVKTLLSQWFLPLAFGLGTLVALILIPVCYYLLHHF